MHTFLDTRILARYRCPPAQVVELVDALDSKSSSERSVGSIPTLGTIPASPNYFGPAAVCSDLPALTTAAS